MNNTVRFASYNSTGFNQLQLANVVQHNSYFYRLASSSDVLFIQEHWLTDTQLPRLLSLLPDFAGTGISGIDESASVLKGRPYGGCAILWRDSFAHFMTPCTLKCLSRRLCGCTMKFDNEVLSPQIHNP